MSVKIEVLTHACAVCQKDLKENDRVTSLYAAGEVNSFANQAALGIAGANVRNYWAHLYCHNTKLAGYPLVPDIHTCIECRKSLSKEDMIVPVFRVLNPKMINPNDLTDFGVELSDRIYFIHYSCRNTVISKDYATKP